jgi:probable rRNA maturation factor
VALEVEVQYACDAPNLPGRAQFERWAQTAWRGVRDAELVIRIVDVDESAELNRRYRCRSSPTNVLSFPFEPPPQVQSPLLGDLVICAPVIAREACAQAKPELSHWAHMIVHGMLHLQGFAHEAEHDAQRMESLEIEIMARLGYPNPYE